MFLEVIRRFLKMMISLLLILISSDIYKFCPRVPKESFSWLQKRRVFCDNSEVIRTSKRDRHSNKWGNVNRWHGQLPMIIPWKTNYYLFYLVVLTFYIITYINILRSAEVWSLRFTRFQGLSVASTTYIFPTLLFMILSCSGHILVWVEVASRNFSGSFPRFAIFTWFPIRWYQSSTQRCLTCEVPVWWHKNTLKRPKSWRRCCRLDGWYWLGWLG